MNQQNSQETEESKGPPETGKRGLDHVQNNSIMDPTLVTEPFTSTLCVCGKQVALEAVCKDNRNGIVWENSKLPRRRPAVWLLVRVVLRLSMRKMRSYCIG